MRLLLDVTAGRLSAMDEAGLVGGEVEDHFSVAAVLMAMPALGLAALAHQLLAGRMARQSPN